MAAENSHAVNPSVYAEPAYDPVRDFAPTGTFADVSGVLVVGPDVPVETFEKFVTLLKEAPGEYAFASSGNGCCRHLFAEVFMAQTGTQMVHVPYNGLGPAPVDVMGGPVEAVFDNLPSAIGQIESGAVKALAVSAPERSPSLPDVPPYSELGFDALDTPSWYGLAAPARVSDDILDQLNAALREAVEDPADPDDGRAGLHGGGEGRGAAIAFPPGARRATVPAVRRSRSGGRTAARGSLHFPESCDR